MALPTGSGTETIHSHLFEDVDATQTLIQGAQYHVYTVLSIIVKCHVLNATTDKAHINLVGYDAHAGSSGGASGSTMQIASFNIQAGETYVWNDKFAFNGNPIISPIHKKHICLTITLNTKIYISRRFVKNLCCI